MAELDFILTAADVALFVLGVLAWAAILVGACAVVAVAFWLRDLWRKR